MLKYFVTNPTKSILLLILLTIFGISALARIPVTLYPFVSTPTLSVSGFLAGASPKTIENAVLKPLESRILALSNIDYITSDANSNGNFTINVVFAPDSDRIQAQIDLQNVLNSVSPELPPEVVKNGVIVSRSDGILIMAISIFSAESGVDQLFVSNYASRYLVDEIQKINGVENATIFGALTYAMRIWFDPQKLLSYDLTAQDVVAEIQQQNRNYSVGKIAQAPVKDGYYEYLITNRGQFNSAQQFSDVVVKSSETHQIYLKDVARIEIGSDQYNENATYNNKPSILIGVFQSPQGNALTIASDVKRILNRAKTRFPHDLDYQVKFDNSKYIDRSIKSVVKSLVEAVFIVACVVILFLRSWRYAVVPLAVIPVSIASTIAVLYLMGCSLNLVTLLAMVLSIGIVVDDAIIIVDAVDYRIEKLGNSVLDACVGAVRDMWRPIVATTLVLLAAFLPLIFIPGISGSIYREFSLTLSLSVTFSAICALILSPSLCYLLLCNTSLKKAASNSVTRSEKILFAPCVTLSKSLFRHPWLTMVLLFSAAITLVLLLKSMSVEYVPGEDKGYLTLSVSNLQNTPLTSIQETMHDITALVMKDVSVDSVLVVNGFNFLAGNGANHGLAFIILKDWSLRDSEEHTLSTVKYRLESALSEMEIPSVSISIPSASPGGGGSGFSLYLKDIDDRGIYSLQREGELFVDQARELYGLDDISVAKRSLTPLYELSIDQLAAAQLGIGIEDAYAALSYNFGSGYISEFSMLGKKYKVLFGADSEFRDEASDLDSVFVRSEHGRIFSVSDFAKLSFTNGPSNVSRYNGFNAVSISGSDNGNLDQSIAYLNANSRSLSKGYEIEFSGQAKEAMKSKRIIVWIFIASIAISYIILVLVYESWLVPLSIIAILPVSLLGSCIAINTVGFTLNMYSVMGLLLVVGISSKTAILIVDSSLERARLYRPLRACYGALKNRLRAVYMTTLAFIIGIFPLMLAVGPGSGAQRSISFPILGGMITLLFFGVCFSSFLVLLSLKARGRI